MSTRTNTTAIGAVVLTLALSFSGASSAFGVTSAGATREPVVHALAADAVQDPRLTSATDLELLTLLLTGTGPIAEASPELLAELGITPAASAEQVDRMVLTAERFLAATPAFATTWAPAIKSSDPTVRDQGIDGFMTDFVAFVLGTCRPSCPA